MKSTKKWLALALSASMALGLTACGGNTEPTPTPDADVASGMTAGTYEVSATGFHGDIKLSVTVDEEKIVSIDVVDHSETEGVGAAALPKLVESVLEHQTIGVDSVSGATVTSEAFKSAMNDALTQAGADMDKMTAPVNEGGELATADAENTQVVIVGGGLAGLMAAYELKDDHPEVDYILVEKLDILTGSIPATGGAIIATTSDLHSVDNNECTTQDIVDLFEYTSNTSVNESLVKNVYENSAEAVNRLVEWGCNLINPTKSSSYSDTVVAYWQENGGAGMAATINAYLGLNPINVRTGTTVENLLVEDGRVVGVHVSDKEKQYDIKADYVILATGGFGSSDEYMTEYLPLFADGVLSTNAGATGDGITMTERFGTKVVGAGSMGTIVAPDNTALINATFMVNKSGERFIGETQPKYVLQRAVSQQEDCAAYLIVDSTYGDMDTINEKIEKGYVKKYETLEELAAENGIDVDGLLATVAAYNSAVDAGEDIPAKEYSLPVASAVKLEQAPFYVEKATLRTFGTIPGIEVNENCQVLDGNGQVIEGLYGAGELIAGNAFTRQYPGAGVGIAWAANSGRFVAEQVADLLK